MEARMGVGTGEVMRSRHLRSRSEQLRQRMMEKADWMNHLPTSF